ncbi:MULTISPECIES: hypothetical protein [unclassified Rhizobium]
MKARRNFIVEFKSGRRQQRRQGASIWGDTDLKAIARAVESDLAVTGGSADAELGAVRPSPAPHRSESRILETIVKPDEQPSGAALVKATTSDLPTQPADLPQPSAKTDDAANVPVLVPAQEETAPAAPARRRAASKAMGPRKKTQARSASAGISQQAGADDLNALEAENRRLKALWRAHLHAENAELRNMLARLSVI